MGWELGSIPGALIVLASVSILHQRVGEASASNWKEIGMPDVRNIFQACYEALVVLYIWAEVKCNSVAGWLPAPA